MLLSDVGSIGGWDHGLAGLGNLSSASGNGLFSLSDHGGLLLVGIGVPKVEVPAYGSSHESDRHTGLADGILKRVTLDGLHHGGTVGVLGSGGGGVVGIANGSKAFKEHPYGTVESDFDAESSL